MKLLLTYFDPKVTKIFNEKYDESGKKIVSLSSTNNYVFRDEIIARIIDVDTPEDAKKYLDSGHTYYTTIPYFKFKTGSGIYFNDSDKSYRSSIYGFVAIDLTKTLRVILPFQVNKLKTKAYFLIYPTKDKKLPTYNHIEEVLQMNKIMAYYERTKIEEQISTINLENPSLTKVLVAESKSPVDGRKEYYEPLINIKKKAGKLMSDGHIDFKQVDSIIQVTKGTELLKRYPEVKAVDGYSIFGDKITAGTEAVQGYLCGENIIPSKTDENIYIAGLDGCVTIESRKVSVKPVAVINGDVDYETGNIEFNGSIHVMGSVLPGFELKAQNDIIVEGNVDDAVLKASGNIIVKLGIAGKGSSVIIADGEITCKYILNSRIEAKGNITVEDSIINSNVFSNDKIFVVSHHGKIMGGEILARHEIDVNIAGSAKETNTTLIVGRNIEVEKELKEIKVEVAKVKEVVAEIMGKIKSSYGATLFEDPKKFISILPDIKKKHCIQLLSDLSKNNKELKTLSIKGMQTEEKLVLDQDPVIVVKDKIFPGTQLYIKKRGRKIEEPIENAKFFEHPQEKHITFSPAV